MSKSKSSDVAVAGLTDIRNMLVEVQRAVECDFEAFHSRLNWDDRAETDRSVNGVLAICWCPSVNKLTPVFTWLRHSPLRCPRAIRV